MTEMDEIREYQENRDRSVVVQIETRETNSIGQVQETQDDDALKSMSPLLNSMRLFGLYFTRTPRMSTASTSQHSGRSVTGCCDWNAGRIYATFMLLSTWLNAVRYSIVFDGSEFLGLELFLKLTIIPTALHTAVLHTAYYCASYAGSLNRVLTEACLFLSESHATYRRRIVIVTAISWTLIASIAFSNFYALFVSNQVNDMALILVLQTFRMSELQIFFIKAVSFVLQLQSLFSWALPQARCPTS